MMEHEMLNLVPASRPDAPDACGCTPPPTSGDSLQGAEILPTESTPTPTIASADEEPRRALKLVVTLTPAEHGQYRASLALGSDGCDPILRTATVTALPDALERVPTLLEDAEAHWRLQPRNRAVSPMPPHRPAADRRPPAATRRPRADQAVAEERPSDDHAEPDIAMLPVSEAVERPKQPSAGQLTLFGGE